MDTPYNMLESKPPSCSCTGIRVSFKYHDYRDMFNIVQLAKEQKQFEEDTSYFRELEKSLTEPQHDDDNDTPVFNKRLFASQGRY